MKYCDNIISWGVSPLICNYKKYKSEYLISKKIILDFLHIDQFLRKSILEAKKTKSIHMHFHVVQWFIHNTLLFLPSLLVLPFFLWDAAEVSHWTLREACPQCLRGVCCVRHSSSPSAWPGMKTRRRGEIKAEIKFKLYSELRIHIRLCLSRKMWLMSPSAALGSSPQVELPFAVVAPQSFRDVLQPFEWEQKDICRCWLKYLKWDSNKSWNILFKRVSGWYWLPTLLRAATLCASWASISGNVSALCRVCWSFCFASSRRSCSCLFFSSL